MAPTSGLTFSHISPNFALDFLITAAESKGVGKLLSSPQLVTQNNAQAIVKQGDADSDSDHHQQHDLRAVRRRGAEASGHSADHRRRHGLHGRAGREHADR